MLISKFTPGLQGCSRRMSASEVNSAINFTDTAAEIETKLSKYAFSGRQVLSVDQQKLRGNSSIDLAFQFLTIFLDDDVELETVAREYGTGQGDSLWSSGQVKKKAVSVLREVISEHQDLFEWRDSRPSSQKHRIDGHWPLQHTQSTQSRDEYTNETDLNLAQDHFMISQTMLIVSDL